MSSRPPPRYKVIEWYRWQESKMLSIFQFGALLSISLTLTDPVVWEYMTTSIFGGVVALIGIVSLWIWVYNIMTKIEVFALKDHISFLKNGRVFIDIPLNESDTFNLTYQPNKFPHIYSGFGVIIVTHKGRKIGYLHVNSRRLVSYIASNLSQFINCHPDLVRHPEYK